MQAKSKTTSPSKNRSKRQKTTRKDTRRTKADVILDPLKRPKGAGIANLVKATGWQKHSVRAALSGLRNRGIAVERIVDDRGNAIYRVDGDS